MRKSGWLERHELFARNLKCHAKEFRFNLVEEGESMKNTNKVGDMIITVGYLKDTSNSHFSFNLRHSPKDEREFQHMTLSMS